MLKDDVMFRKRFVIIDGNAILHRAYHALPPFMAGGVLVNAVYGFATTLFKIIREMNPESIVVAFDTKEPTFRHKEYKEYKAHREKKPQELYDQLAYIKKFLEAMRVSYLELPGYEADDIIAALSEKISKETKDQEAMIVTGDMDTLQLVSPRVKVYTFKRGLSDAQIYDEEKVMERYGLPPSALIDFKGLRGDPSDNIPGVAGIGEVTATELIKNFGSIEKLYDALKKNAPEAKKITPRVRALLLASQKDAILGKHLVTLIKDLPFKFLLKTAERQPIKREEMAEFLRRLGFQSLLGRVDELLLSAPTPEEVAAKAPDFIILKSEKQALDFLTKIKEDEIVLHARELNSKLQIIAIIAGGKKFAVILEPSRAVLSQFRLLFSDSKKIIIGHDLKKIFHLLGAGDIKAGIFDSMIASYLIDPGSRAHGLRSLAFSILGMEVSGGGVQQTLLAGEEEQLKDIFDEASAILKLKNYYVQELEEKKLKKLFEEIEMPLLPILFDMEKDGVLIDTVFLNQMSRDFGRRILKLQKKIYEFSGEEFNVNSPAQLGKILFEKLGLSAKSVKKTATGAALSTAAAELEKLRGAHPIIDLLFAYRELSKLKSTYIDALPELIDKKSNRVHTTFNQAVTATGRLSSSNPNLQNIPTKTELGREIRKAFMAKKGFSLIAADYSQIELRIAAHLSGDKAMIEDFRSGEDIHTRTAEIIWGINHDDVTKEMRRIAKAINFGIIYGMGPKTLSVSAGVSMKEAADFIDKFFVGRARLHEYLEELKVLAASQGYAETMFGRRRYLPEITSGVPMLRAEAERQAVNTPIQGTSADIIKIAMINLFRILEKHFGENAAMILQVHDELVFEVKDSATDEAAGIIRENMETAVKLSVPVAVEIEIGKNWGEMREWK